MAIRSASPGLTAAHVARVPVFTGDVSAPAIVLADDADRHAAIDALLSCRPASGPIHLFAYGSLIWKPGCEVVDQRPGLARGWRRSFCLGWDHWFRGSPERPGLMMSLDRGGSCRGVICRLPDGREDQALLDLFRREMLTRSNAHHARWLRVETTDGPTHALAFVINPAGPRYVPGLSTDELAEVLAVAAGPVGTMVDYLHQTCQRLEQLGIRDSHLAELQRKVAAVIDARWPEPPAAKTA